MRPFACFALTFLLAVPALATSPGDCAGDGVTSRIDLGSAVSTVLERHGATACAAADANADGRVSLADLVLIAGAFGTGVPAPASVGPEGGRIVAGDEDQRVVIDVPPAALASPVTITATPLASLAIPGLISGVELGPSGTAFDVPVSVRFEGAGAAGWGGLATQPGVDDALLVTEIDGDDAVIRVPHFSAAYVGFCPVPSDQVPPPGCVGTLQAEACAAQLACIGSADAACVEKSIDLFSHACYSQLRDEFAQLTQGAGVPGDTQALVRQLNRNRDVVRQLIDWLVILQANTSPQDQSAIMQADIEEGIELAADGLRLSVNAIMAHALATDDWTQIRHVSRDAPSLYSILADDELLARNTGGRSTSLLYDIGRYSVVRPYIEALRVDKSIEGRAIVSGFVTVRMANTPVTEGPVSISISLRGAVLEGGASTGTFTPDSMGRFTIVIHPTSPEVVVEVEATWNGLDRGAFSLGVSSSEVVTWTAEGLGSLALCMDAAAGGCWPTGSLPAGETAGIHATVRFNGRNVPGVAASFTLEGGGRLSPPGFDASRTATTMFTAPDARGVSRVTAHAVLGGASLTDTIDITVLGEDIPAVVVPPPVPPPPPRVIVQPASITVDGGKTVAFSASVTGLSSPAVRWSVEAPAGTISDDGVLTAGRHRGRYVVKATSLEDPLVFGLAEVEVQVVGCGGPEGQVNFEFYWFAETQEDLETLAGISGFSGLFLGTLDPTVPNPDPITSLAPLESMTEIDGELVIARTALTSLEGLCNLRMVRSLSIYENPNLASLEGLDSLRAVPQLKIGPNGGFNGTMTLAHVETVGPSPNPFAPALELESYVPHAQPWTLSMPALHSVAGDCHLLPLGAPVGFEAQQLTEVTGDILTGNSLSALRVPALERVRNVSLSTSLPGSPQWQLGSGLRASGALSVGGLSGGSVSLNVAAAAGVSVGSCSNSSVNLGTVSLDGFPGFFGSVGVESNEDLTLQLSTGPAASLRIARNKACNLTMNIGPVETDVEFGGYPGTGNEDTPLTGIRVTSCGDDLLVRYNSGLCDEDALDWAQLIPTHSLFICCNTCEQGGSD